MKQDNNSSKRIKTKLYLTLVCMVVAFAVLGAATYAWYTLSTNPEITGIKASVNVDKAIKVSLSNSPDSYTLSTELNIPDYAPLIPVSTVDGLNWFVCKYDIDGDVLQEADTSTTHAYEGTQFNYLRFPDGGNISATATDVYKSTLGNLSKDVVSYYVYKDIYLKTENTKTDVYLSLPSAYNTTAGYEQQDTENNHYGTYVLSYSQDDENKTIDLLENGSETAVRVGIMPLGVVADTEAEDATITRAEDDPADLQNPDGVVNSPQYYYVTSNTAGTNNFIIYEPNADSRSYVDKHSSDYETDLYIAGFAAKTFNAGDSATPKYYGDLGGYYLQTYPIRATAATQAEIDSYLIKSTDSDTVKASKLAALKARTAIYDWLYTGQVIGTTTDRIDGIETTFDTTKLIVQRTSTWKAALKTSGLDQETEEDGTTRIRSLKEMFDSTQVGTMGTFFKYDNGVSQLQYVSAKTPEGTHYTNADYTAVKASDINSEYRSSVKITTLEKGKPQKIRIYFWIEGQDVDCWNDISKTDFLVNLEFVSDVITD